MKYFVLNEHTLIYRDPYYPEDYYGILRASVIRGSTYSPLAGTLIASPLDNLRDATVDDFIRYNVHVPPDMF